MVYLIVRKMHSNQKPYAEISKDLLTILKNNNTMQHIPSPAFLELYSGSGEFKQVQKENISAC